MTHEKLLRPQMATFLRLVRILRMLRILKLSRYSRGLRILGMTLYRSARVLSLLVMFQVGKSLNFIFRIFNHFFKIVLAVTFGSLVFYMEFDAPDAIDIEITSIPEGIWFAIITMTTVGYGDVVPKTVMGKVRV